MSYRSCPGCRSQNRQTDPSCYSCGASLIHQSDSKLDRDQAVPEDVATHFQITATEEALTLTSKSSNLFMTLAFALNTIVWCLPFVVTRTPAHLLFMPIGLITIPNLVRCLTIQTSWVLRAGSICRLDRRGASVNSYEQAGKQLRAFYANRRSRLYFMAPGEKIALYSVPFMECKKETREVREWLEKTTGLSFS